MIEPGMHAGVPPANTAVPEGLLSALHAMGLGVAPLRPVWLNEAGGITFAVSNAREADKADFYVQWNPTGSGESLFDEAVRLRWLQGRHPVPHVVELIVDDAQEVLVTKALPGESAVSAHWRGEPETALRALGQGLRRLHDVAIESYRNLWNAE
ncbi:hypothetical protein ACXR2W_12185 [Leucobacter sp. HY1908]